MAHSSSRSPVGRRDNDDFKRSHSGSRGGKRSQERNSPAEPDNKGNVIYIGNLPRLIEEEDIRKVFEEFGRIENIEVVKDPSTKGFCFITYSDGEEALKAKEKTDGIELKGRPMKVQVARRGKGHQKTPGAYMGHSRSRGHRGGRRSPSPYRRRRRSRSGGRRNSRERYDRYDKDRRSRSRSGGRSRRGGERDRYRSRSPRDRYNRDRSRSRSPRRR